MNYKYIYGVYSNSNKEFILVKLSTKQYVYYRIK